MHRTSDNTGRCHVAGDTRRVARRLSGPLLPVCQIVGILLLGGGCEGVAHMQTGASEKTTVTDQSLPYTYPDEAQIVTAGTWKSVLSPCRGRPLVLCLWRTSHPDAAAGLNLALQVQAEYAAGGILGVNLDPADAWRPAVVPMLQKAQVRFPVVAIPEGEQGVILRQLGLPGALRGVTYVVLGATGVPIATRAAGRPVVTVRQGAAVARTSGEAVGAASRPAAGAAGAASAPASRPARQSGRGMLFYSLRVVRLTDGIVVGRADGVGLARDVREASEAGAQEAKRSGADWLETVALQVAAVTRPGTRLAVAPVAYEAAGGEGVASDAGMAFSSGVAAAVAAQGRAVMPPAEVLARIAEAGLTVEAVEQMPSLLRAGLAAEYLVTGTVWTAEGGTRR